MTRGQRSSQYCMYVGELKMIRSGSVRSYKVDAGYWRSFLLGDEGDMTVSYLSK